MNRNQSSLDESDHFGVTTRPKESVSAPNSSFTEGVATKDIHINPFTSLLIRIFLPESALNPPEPDSSPQSNAEADLPRNPLHLRKNSYGSPNAAVAARKEEYQRSSYSGHDSADVEAMSLNGKSNVYKGYAPVDMNRRKLVVML
ncbi:putative carboxylesterase 11 [Citrus sinensis]|nr:putative carboxylesterase 11 [Citrus sinensis]